jgi:hypothetical protein
MSAAHPITIRRPQFAYPAHLDPMVWPGQPELSYVLVGLSLLLPYLEPYLIRTMNEAKRRITDPELAADVALFNGQEGQHYRAHMRFNDAVREGYPTLAPLEAELERDYQRFTEERSLKWNLAFAEGFEAYTCATARFSLEEGLLQKLHPAARDLFEWHLVEEMEHRCVAFDAYEHLFGSYLYRLAVGFYAQWHLNRFVDRAARAMLDEDRQKGRDHGGPAAAWKRLEPHLSLMLRRLFPKVLRTYLPGYTPHRIEMPEGVAALLARPDYPGAGS